MKMEMTSKTHLGSSYKSSFSLLPMRFMAEVESIKVIMKV